MPDRGPKEMAALLVTLLAVGLLVTGPLAGCGSQQGPAQSPATQPPATQPPPTVATALPTAAPLPLPRPEPPGGPAHPEPGLGPDDRALLIEARRVGAQWLTLLVAPEPGRTAEVSAGLEQLGGVLGTTSPGPGYLRLTMPTDQVERAAALPGISALDIEHIISPNKPRPTG